MTLCTLYTTLPHNQIKEKRLDLIEWTFYKKEGKLYLVCNDKKAFFTSTDHYRGYHLWSCQNVCDFPFLDADVPRRPPYGVYISKLIRFARVCSHVDDFNTRNKCLTANLIYLLTVKIRMVMRTEEPTKCLYHISCGG